MKLALTLGALALMSPQVATAADTVPMTVQVTGCEGCSLSATWSKGGTAQSKHKSATKKVRDGSVRFDVPKGYWVYFTGTSPRAAVDAASVLVTQFTGSAQGERVSAKRAQTFNDGASYCLRARKQTITARANLVKLKRTRLLSLWASPQLAAQGTQINDGIKGVYGTQNTLICSGMYY